MEIGVVGGGAAGYFGAIFCAEAHPDCRVTLFEAGSQTLAKVKISGGGRCNVTTGVQEPRELIRYYPRGGRELLGPFTRWGSRETMAWFETRGVALKTEADGRVFPQTDRSETITDCLEQAAQQAGVKTLTRAGVRKVERTSDGGFQCGGDVATRFDRILLATGSAQVGYDMAQHLGHTMVPCVPSLFSFVIGDTRLAGLAGVSVPKAGVRIDHGKAFEHVGPLLVTHWGLSGPAVLKLSAWAARFLSEAGYKATLTLDWLPDQRDTNLSEQFSGQRLEAGAKTVESANPTTLPARLWSRLVKAAGIDSLTLWSRLTREQNDRLRSELKSSRYAITGKGEFKEEFVTAGGVDLKEVDFRTMESRLCPGLYFAGEILDIDGLTGGFNLQSAWTTGYLAGLAMGETS